MKGWVYLIGCDATPGLIKIGQSSKHPQMRLAELQSTGVPGKLSLLWCALVDNYAHVERVAHGRMASERRHNEWFEVTLARAHAEITNLIAARGWTVYLTEGGPQTIEPSGACPARAAFRARMAAQDAAYRKSVIVTQAEFEKAMRLRAQQDEEAERAAYAKAVRR